MDTLFFGKYRSIALTLYIILLVSWLTFIFFNSALDGENSTEQSDKIVNIVENIVHSINPDAVVDSASVRKSAHFFEFAVLGALYFVGTLFFKHKTRNLYLNTFFLSFFTAFLDETLQLFSEGRGAEITDVWIDFSGASIGIFLMLFLFYSKTIFKIKRFRQ